MTGLARQRSSLPQLALNATGNVEEAILVAFLHPEHREHCRLYYCAGMRYAAL
jgi:hypothetical protein